MAPLRSRGGAVHTTFATLHGQSQICLGETIGQTRVLACRKRKIGRGHANDPNDEVFEALAVGSDLCLSDNHSAHDAFAREIIAHETTDWTEQDLGLKGKVPFVMMNGLQNPQVTPETLAEFKRDYPWIEFDVFEDAGQLLFFSKWPQVPDRLEPFFDRP